MRNLGNKHQITLSWAHMIAPLEYIHYSIVNWLQLSLALSPWEDQPISNKNCRVADFPTDLNVVCLIAVARVQQRDVNISHMINNHSYHGDEYPSTYIRCVQK